LVGKHLTVKRVLIISCLDVADSTLAGQLEARVLKGVHKCNVFAQKIGEKFSPEQIFEYFWLRRLPRPYHSGRRLLDVFAAG